MGAPLARPTPRASRVYSRTHDIPSTRPLPPHAQIPYPPAALHSPRAAMHASLTTQPLLPSCAQELEFSRSPDEGRERRSEATRPRRDGLREPGELHAARRGEVRRGRTWRAISTRGEAAADADTPMPPSALANAATDAAADAAAADVAADVVADAAAAADAAADAASDAGDVCGRVYSCIAVRDTKQHLCIGVRVTRGFACEYAPYIQ